MSHYDCYTICTINGENEGKIFFVLSQSPETFNLSSDAMPQFCVDEEIEQPTEENKSHVVIVKPGKYNFQKDLGLYGGYEVSVKYKLQ